MTVHYSMRDDRYWIHDEDGDIMWFDSPLDAKREAHKVLVAKAVKAERAKIASWLRSLGDDKNHFLPATLANWLEEGMHEL